MAVSDQCHPPAMLYLQEQDCQYPLNSRLGGPQKQSGHRLEEKSLAPVRDRTQVIQTTVRHYTDSATLAQTCHMAKFQVL
jgi:hypothetical protein